MLISWLRKCFWLQNLACRVICSIPMEVHHNLSKLAALRDAFAFAAVEGIEGDYVEFGVFEGNSMVAAIHSYNYQTVPGVHQFGLNPCRFFGFDSFQGFILESKDSSHPVWKSNEMNTSIDRVRKRLGPLSKKAHVELVPGYFKDVLPTAFDKHGIKKIRVCLIDCDLISSTEQALNFSASYWQQGTVLVVDDYFSYAGDPKKGVSGAFHEFFIKHPEFKYRDFATFGFNGIVKIVIEPPVMNKALLEYSRPENQRNLADSL